MNEDIINEYGLDQLMNDQAYYTEEVVEVEEIINQIENMIITINDVREIIVLMFGFIVGYIIIRDFLNNILKSI